MKILEPVFIQVIESLLKCQVEFLLIGGYAVNYYGYGRYTGDIDFWLRPRRFSLLLSRRQGWMKPVYDCRYGFILSIYFDFQLTFAEKYIR